MKENCSNCNKPILDNEQELEEMSSASGSGSSLEGCSCQKKSKEHENLVREFIRKKYKQIKNNENVLRKLIQEYLILEKEEDKEFSKYYGINVLNHEVLSQIKDDIRTMTKSLGDNTEFVEYFKRYVVMYLEDLIETSFDMSDIDNEIEQIRDVLQEQRLDFDPSQPEGSPIDSELFTDDEQETSQKAPGNDVDDETLTLAIDTPTQQLGGEERALKRNNFELNDGGQQDAKKQAIDLMNNIDDIIIKGYEKISDDLNKELYLRYLVINILLHIDKAHNKMKEEPPELDVPEYEQKKSEMENTMNNVEQAI